MFIGRRARTRFGCAPVPCRYSHRSTWRRTGRRIGVESSRFLTATAHTFNCIPRSRRRREDGATSPTPVTLPPDISLQHVRQSLVQPRFAGFDVSATPARRRSFPSGREYHRSGPHMNPGYVASTHPRATARTQLAKLLGRDSRSLNQSSENFICSADFAERGRSLPHNDLLRRPSNSRYSEGHFPRANIACLLAEVIAVSTLSDINCLGHLDSCSLFVGIVEVCLEAEVPGAPTAL